MKIIVVIAQLALAYFILTLPFAATMGTTSKASGKRDGRSTQRAKRNARTKISEEARSNARRKLALMSKTTEYKKRSRLLAVRHKAREM